MSDTGQTQTFCFIQ